MKRISFSTYYLWNKHNAYCFHFSPDWQKKLRLTLSASGNIVYEERLSPPFFSAIQRHLSEASLSFRSNFSLVNYLETIPFVHLVSLCVHHIALKWNDIWTSLSQGTNMSATTKTCQWITVNGNIGGDIIWWYPSDYGANHSTRW